MGSARPLVSVLMPSLNQAGFIESAVRSVLDQDYPNLELVVADGGSTDGTLQRLEALLGEYGTRLRWVSGPDTGPACAVNKALALARGGLIGWLNSDDLYAPGAVAAAVAQLADDPKTVMLYGEGEHIDAGGQSLGRYPTRPPQVGIEAFHAGCFICQPTVFLRREVFDAVGPLDESLAAAFDFELWLRAFRRFPGQIAHIDRLLAFSRLHAATITQRQRRRVAVEGIRVLAKHLGSSQPHWLLTYFEEVCAVYPFGEDIPDLKAHAQDVLGQVKTCFDSDALRSLEDALSKDARLNIALPGIFANVYADGWAPPVLALRCRGAQRSLRIQCVHARPRFAPLPIRIKTHWGLEYRMVIDRPGPFGLMVDFPPAQAGDNRVVLIESDNFFIPQAADPRSTDGRKLAFRVEGLRLSP